MSFGIIALVVLAGITVMISNLNEKITNIERIVVSDTLCSSFKP
jgi:hypothetical protein